jgi:bacterioferritin-associated ferredoxin
MFVCSCRVVSDQSVRRVIDTGAQTVDEITARCGAGGVCGACRPTLERILGALSEADTVSVAEAA